MEKNNTLVRIEENIIEVSKLLSIQKMNVNDGYKLLQTLNNVHIRFEELLKSRDKWKNKYMELKKSKE